METFTVFPAFGMCPSQVSARIAGTKGDKRPSARRFNPGRSAHTFLIRSLRVCVYALKTSP